MTLLAQLGDALPECYYLGLDVGYKEHAAYPTPAELAAVCHLPESSELSGRCQPTTSRRRLG